MIVSSYTVPVTVISSFALGGSSLYTNKKRGKCKKRG